MKAAQSCPTLCDPVDYTVHGILQARILEWVAFPFSRGSFQPRDRTWVSHIAGQFFTSWAYIYLSFCCSNSIISQLYFTKKKKEKAKIITLQKRASRQVLGQGSIQSNLKWRLAHELDNLQSALYMCEWAHLILIFCVCVCMWERGERCVLCLWDSFNQMLFSSDLISQGELIIQTLCRSHSHQGVMHVY